MGPDKLRERQRAFREREIARVTAALLAQTDCGSLTMDQVAAALGTSKASIYRMFSRATLLQRAVAEAVRDVLEEARTAAAKAGQNGAFRAAARVLVQRWLSLAPKPHGLRAPCCLKEVECPYVDWEQADDALRELAAASDVRKELGHRQMKLARALRALAAVRMYQLRSLGRKPTRADVDAVLRYLFPDAPKTATRGG